MRSITIRSAGVLAVAFGAALLLPAIAAAQAFEPGTEHIARYGVDIRIEPNSDIVVTETINYDFAGEQRHGIYRDVPERMPYRDTAFDRVYRIAVLSVTASPGTPSSYEVFHENGYLRVRIGDPDRTVTGRHTYTIAYRVRGAMNAFADHDELYWNAIGPEWSVAIQRAAAVVSAPAAIAQVACFAGPRYSRLPCDRASAEGNRAVFGRSGLGPFEALTVVVALPKGAVTEPRPILEERWSLARAFAVNPGTVGGSLGLLAAIVGGIVWLGWRRGRDRRYRGSPIDQVMGNPTGEEQSVPLFESGEAPVEFAPPEDLRPGQIGTLIDERANTLDVTATIVDLAVRHYLVIEEIPKTGWFGRSDWTLIRQPAPGDELLTYERMLLDHLFESGDEVRLSELKTRFASKLKEVETALYTDALRRRWFVSRPDRVRATWIGIGVGVLVLGLGLGYILARWTHVALLAVPVICGGLLLMVAARWMPRRTARGTALARRVHGFRRVIETAETHMSRWAEEENVFTRFLPFAIVFGCTEKWATAFAGLATAPATDTTWYVSPRPFVFADFGDRMDGFAVTTSGIISSTPAGSGGSGLGGGGSSGGGGGGGGGGSW